MSARRRFLVLLALLAEICAGEHADLGTVGEVGVQLHQGLNAETLKLNVSWSPPRGKPPSSYSVTVAGLPDESTSDCPEGSIFYTSKDNKELSVLLPQTSGFIDMSEMHIFPGCSYEIEVQANPRLRPSIRPAKVLYKVPECVSDKCQCLSAKSTLPVPKVTVIRRGELLSVEWDAFNASNVQSYSVSVGHPILTSRNGRAVYNATKVGDVHAPRAAFQLNPEESQTRIQGGYKIAVAAVDSRGCLGDEGVFIVPSALVESDSTEMIWFLLAGVIAVCATLGMFLLIRTRERHKLFWRSRSISRIHAISRCKSSWAEAMLNRANILYVRYEPQAERAPDSDDLEVSYENLSLVHELGRGQFGRVYLGRLDDGEGTLVAVKTSQSDELDQLESKKQFMEEIDMMRQAGDHPHLVRLIGYCSQPEKPVCIILEYMQGGDLLAYLHSRRKLRRPGSQSTSGRSSRPSISETLYTTLSYISEGSYQGNPLYSPLRQTRKYTNVPEATNEQETLELEDGSIGRKQFLRFATDIASGMRHLESKGITHRDLAARNILMASDLTLKISDFGLSREGVYVIRTKGSKARHLPIRWMSPEAIRDRAFSTKSDVWAFAIVLWEIGTLGSFPYHSVRDDRLLRCIVREGARLEQPETISMDVYRLMRQCWATEPEDRPSFQQVWLDLRAISAPTTAENPCYALPLESLQS